VTGRLGHRERGWCRRRAALVTGLVIVAAACSPTIQLGPEQSGAPSFFELDAPALARSEQPPLPYVVTVLRPVAPPSIDSRRIAMEPAPHELAYLAGARWADVLTRMLQTVIVESFESDGRVHVVTDGMQATATYTLETDVREFHVIDDGGKPEVEVAFQARILGGSPVGLVASRRFEGRQAVHGHGAESAVDSFNAVVADSLERLVDWTAAVLTKQPRPTSGKS
jgi:cholesterol transport system auxiliary component